MVMTATVCMFLILCIYLGVRHAGSITDLRSFALGYKNISTAALVLTIYATHLGAGSTLGLVERINNIGLVCVVVALLSIGNWYITKLIFCRNISRFADCISQPHIMEKLYGPLGLWVSNIVNIIFSVGIVAIQVVVIGFIVQYLSGWSSVVGIILGAGVVTIYSTSGGVRAVILTDLMQAGLFLSVIGIVFVLSMQQFAADPMFLSSLPASKVWIIPHDWHAALLIIAMLAQALTPFGEQPPFLQRLLISGSPKQLNKVFSYVALIDFSVILVISVAAILLLPSTGNGAISKFEIFTVINNNMNPVLVTITVIGLLAVTMSTADSWLNAAAVIISHDIIKKYEPHLTDTEEVRVARVATLLLGTLAGGVAISSHSILSLLLVAENFYKPLILIPMMAGFLGYKCTAKDFKRSVCCALTGVFVGGYIEGEIGFISLLFGLVGSAIGLSWRKKWTLQLPDGSSLFKWPGYRKITPTFLGLIMGLALVHTLIHLYLEQSWIIGDIALPACLAMTLCCILLWAHDELEGRLYKLSLTLALTLLMAAISSLTFRTTHPFGIAYLIFTVFVALAYRQYWPALLGLILGIVSLSFPATLLYMPIISLNTLLAASFVLSVFCGYIFWREINEYVKDILVQLEEEKIAATTDALTNIYNRRYMDIRLTEAVQHAHTRSKELSVMLLDIDRFKELNDDYDSHDVGDEVLRELAKRMKQSVRAIDICSRRGGDEFAIMMPEASLAEAKKIAERLWQAVDEQLFAIPAEPWHRHCTISIGVTTLGSQDSGESLLARADAALYIAKHNGRNSVGILAAPAAIAKPGKLKQKVAASATTNSGVGKN